MAAMSATLLWLTLLGVTAIYVRQSRPVDVHGAIALVPVWSLYWLMGSDTKWMHRLGYTFPSTHCGPAVCSQMRHEAPYMVAQISKEGVG